MCPGATTNGICNGTHWIQPSACRAACGLCIIATSNPTSNPTTSNPTATMVPTASPSEAPPSATPTTSPSEAPSKSTAPSAAPTRRLEHRTPVRLEVTLDASLDDFPQGSPSREQFERNFTQEMATLLSVPEDYVRIDGIYQGSIIVVFDVVPGSTGAAVNPLLTLQTKLSSASSTTLVNFRITNYQKSTVYHTSAPLCDAMTLEPPWLQRPIIVDAGADQFKELPLSEVHLSGAVRTLLHDADGVLLSLEQASAQWKQLSGPSQTSIGDVLWPERGTSMARIEAKATGTFLEGRYARNCGAQQLLYAHANGRIIILKIKVTDRPSSGSVESLFERKEGGTLLPPHFLRCIL